MATLEQLETALRNADAAGDASAARRLAAEIVTLRGRGQAPKPSFTKQALDLAGSMTPLGMGRDVVNAVRDPRQALQTADDSMRLLASGMSFGFADKLAGYMGGEGTEAERTKTAASRDRQGVRGAATEILGSIAPVSTLTKAGATAMNLPGLMGRVLGPSIDGAAYGALTAAGNDQDVLRGAGIGAGFGALGQAAGEGLSILGKPVMARINPDRAAAGVMDDTLKTAGIEPWQLADDLARAADDRQGMYGVMDAMGNPGQRLASTVARSPGPGRNIMVEALEKRQAGQGRRIASALADGFDAPDTAAQRIEALTRSRNSAADVNYGAARSNAGDVDVMPAVAAIDDMLYGGVKNAAGIAPDSIEGALSGVRSRLANADGSAQVVGFDEVLRIKQGIDDAIGKAVRAGENNRARMLGNVKSQLDVALERASPNYRQANDAFRQGSKAIDAVDIGRNAAMRGRFEDTIPAFGKMVPEEQAAYRAGYADPLIAQTQQSAVGVNKARPLINDATAAEFPAFAAPGKGDQLGRRIAREQTMFETRNAALGGSKTADNLADEAAMSIVDPSVMGNLLTGNLWGAGKSAVLQALSSLKGQPAPVRERLARMLVESNPEVARSILEGSRAKTKEQKLIYDTLLRALTVGGTVSTVNQGN